MTAGARQMIGERAEMVRETTVISAAEGGRKLTQKRRKGLMLWSNKPPPTSIKKRS